MGCGEDVSQISPKERRDIGRESSVASEPRERVLLLWTILLKQEFKDHRRIYGQQDTRA